MEATRAVRFADESVLYNDIIEMLVKHKLRTTDETLRTVPRSVKEEIV